MLPGREGATLSFYSRRPEPSGDEVRLQPSPWVGSWSSPIHWVLSSRFPFGLFFWINMVK